MAGAKARAGNPDPDAHTSPRLIPIFLEKPPLHSQSETVPQPCQRGGKWVPRGMPRPDLIRR